MMLAPDLTDTDRRTLRYLDTLFALDRAIEQWGWLMYVNIPCRWILGDGQRGLYQFGGPQGLWPNVPSPLFATDQDQKSSKERYSLDDLSDGDGFGCVPG